MRNALVLGLLALASGFAQAQPPQNPEGPPPPGGPGGPGGPPPLSAAMIPGGLLSSYLALTHTQAGKLKAIHDALQKNRPRPPQPGEQMPSPAEMQKRHKAMEASISSTNKKLDGLLTAPQKTRLKILMKAMGTLQQQHIPPFALQDLRLTAAQVDRLAAGKDALTASQKKQLETMRPPFGGPGGPGGPGR